jgi:hypothetical protein
VDIVRRRTQSPPTPRVEWVQIGLRLHPQPQVVSQLRSLRRGQTGRPGLPLPRHLGTRPSRGPQVFSGPEVAVLQRCDHETATEVEIRQLTRIHGERVWGANGVSVCHYIPRISIGQTPPRLHWRRVVLPRIPCPRQPMPSRLSRRLCSVQRVWRNERKSWRSLGKGGDRMSRCAPSPAYDQARRVVNENENVPGRWGPGCGLYHLEGAKIVATKM